MLSTSVQPKFLRFTPGRSQGDPIKVLNNRVLILALWCGSSKPSGKVSVYTMSELKKGQPFEEREGKKLIFRPWITGKDGKRIYPKKGKVFPIWVDIDSDEVA